ncbi:MAG: PL29 family lyase N-terminal domain-containing protein, partial [Candidatus Cryptobacteroides sp.]
MMKAYKIFAIAAALFAVSCTDELRNDIDTLQDRVDGIALRIQSLNDNLNIVRVALDGNGTISSYVVNEDGSISLTLSDGRNFTINQGVEGGNYPSVEIGDNGNWFVAGEDTGLRAYAEDGEDATITPKFKIETKDGVKTWFVSYDDGKNWEALGSAEGKNSSVNFFENVEVVGSEFRFTFSGRDYVIPVVHNLVCALERPETMMDGMLYVDAGTSVSVALSLVREDGDLLRTIVPDGWTCTCVETDGAISLTLEAPAFSSEGELRVELTRGASSASDRIKVKSFTGSYWSDYLAGLDIPAGYITINRYTHPGAVLVSEDMEITNNSGIYFIDKNVTLTANSLQNIIFIGADQNSRKSSKLVLKGNSGNKQVIYVSTSKEDNGFVCKNLQVSFETAAGGKYYFNTTGSFQLRYFIFEDCDITIEKDKSLSYFSNANG